MSQPVTEEPVVIVNEPPVPAPAPPRSNIVTLPAPTNPDAIFTTADIEAARRQEKDKVYSRIDALQESVKVFEAERAERLAAEASSIEAAAEADRLRREAEESQLERFTRSQAELADQLRAERESREALEATLGKEREYAALESYRLHAIAANTDEILPELLDYVTGNTAAEIDSSIAGLVARSTSILENTSQALHSQRQAAPGPRITAPPNGPLEIQTGQRALTAADIAAMSMTEYAQYRSQLGVTGSGNNRGLFDR